MIAWLCRGCAVAVPWQGCGCAVAIHRLEPERGCPQLGPIGTWPSGTA
jgi:hypothetical protein